MTQGKDTSLIEVGKNVVAELVDEDNKDRDDMNGEGNTSSGKIRIIIVVCAIMITVVCTLFCIQYWSKAMNVSAVAIVEAYDGTKNSIAAQKRHEFWEKGYAKGEKEYRTSNRISISINEIRETANLEVMKVVDTVYVIGDDEGTPPWLKVTGIGVYTVNLAVGEYLIDDERQYVLVRVPRPELATVNIDDVEQLLIKENKVFFNGSIRKGEDLAREQRVEAQIKLLEKIESNQTFYKNAEESSKALIESLVRSFNSDIEDLKVDVEFFD